MRLRVAIAIVLLLNLPWIVLWWYFTLPSGLAKEGTATALFVVLVLGTTGMVVTPCLLIKGLIRKRWLLITMLVFVNLFWCLQWIDTFARSTPHDVRYRAARPIYLAMMAVYSGVVCLLYWLAGRLLGALKRRLAAAQGWGWNEAANGGAPVSRTKAT
ncbi:hypothetical protein ACFLSJ_02050 [Verrucomicrobiota bacterium]